MDEIKVHYYTTHDSLNPKRIIPAGPLDLDFSAPHGSRLTPHEATVAPPRRGSFSEPSMTSSGERSFGMQPDFMPK